MSTATNEPSATAPLPTGTPALEARTLEAPNLGAAGDSLWPRRVLVASDGSPEAEVAILAAKALADRSGASVEMVAVYAPRIPMPPCPGRRGFEQCEAADRIEAAALLRAVRKQRRRRLRHRDWPLRLEVGDPCAVIVQSAKQMPADVVILGIGPSNPEDRSCDVRTAVLTAQYLDAALYAVAPGCELPLSGIVVLADGQVHAPTLRAAAACVAPGGRLSLALPRQDQPATDNVAVQGSAREIVARSCGETFAEQIDHLTIERVDIGEEMVAGVLRLAEEQRAQLIAVPMRGDSGPVRTFLPNVADSLLLAARCSVLVVPDGSAGPLRERLPG